jgi:hypothetical protein
MMANLKREKKNSYLKQKHNQQIVATREEMNDILWR